MRRYVAVRRALCTALFVGALGCGAEIDRQTEDSASSGNAQGPVRSECDVEGNGCPDCVTCLDGVEQCAAMAFCGGDCAAFLECKQAQPNCATGCCEPCREQHPVGAAEADGLFECIFQQACPMTCAELAEQVLCQEEP